MINMVTKSGGNEFHGRFSEAYMRQPGGNITPELQARGLRVGTSLQYFNDASADLGGRIVRDKLWFYGSISRSSQRNHAARPGAGPWPDGVYLTGDEPRGISQIDTENPTIKGQYQMTRKYQFVADYAREITNSDADSQNTPFSAQPTNAPDFYPPRVRGDPGLQVGADALEGGDEGDADRQTVLRSAVRQVHLSAELLAAAVLRHDAGHLQQKHVDDYRLRHSARERLHDVGCRRQRDICADRASLAATTSSSSAIKCRSATSPAMRKSPAAATTTSCTTP